MLLHPTKIVNYLFKRQISRFVTNDEIYLKILYKMETGKKLNIRNPQSFNEKLQWLKLYYQKPEFVIMADKYVVKKYVADVIGMEYVIPLLGA